MITNQKQYKITKVALANFERALHEINTQRSDKSETEIHPVLRATEIAALRSQIQELKIEIFAYERLVSGQTRILEVENIGDLPHVLIKARIAAGLSQKELAMRLKLQEQQIQRYEATEYAGASFSRIKEVAEALRIKMRKEVVLDHDENFSIKHILSRLNGIGLDKEFIYARFLPRFVAGMGSELKGHTKETLSGAAMQIAKTVGRVYGWSGAALFGDTPLGVSVAPCGAARFKLRSKTQERRLTAYAVFAHYLALLVLEATTHIKPQPIPDDSEALRNAIINRYGTLGLRETLSYLWERGVPVLPLCDSGAFHAACWRVRGRNVIVLKQKTTSQARWLFDLLHEVWHSLCEPEMESRLAVDVGDGLQSTQAQEEEEGANIFAGDVSLAGQAETLAEQCVAAANGNVEFLKRVLPRVANQSNVDVGLLANYMAFRLSLQGIDWWGTAQVLQGSSCDPFGCARDLLLSKIDLTRLNEIDQQLLLQALDSQAVNEK